MSDVMRPLNFIELCRRAMGEYAASNTIFGIHRDQFYIPGTHGEYTVFNDVCSLPLGPAAGPHTQLAQNIAASYLTGARFIELKTVQILDTLEIEKPCIDASDEGFNTEWSSEFTLEKAGAEYIRAYVFLHFLEYLFDLGTGTGPSFLFNMSVGYDLKGIQNSRVDAFIESMKNAENHPVFIECLEALKEMAGDSTLFNGTGLELKAGKIADISQSISPSICRQATLSTMHGCPPSEIEKICRYMLGEKNLDLFVKLNPTLLGYEFVSSFLSDAGYYYVELSEESFKHDLSYEDAVPMLRRLVDASKENGRMFGVKLTNTLGTLNILGRLPGNEMYMSGRALFPLSINLAALISEEFAGELPVSFSGGLSWFNIERVARTGIKPLTLATDLLKPGGSLRLKQLAQLLENLTIPEQIDTANLKELAAESLTPKYSYKDKRWHGTKKVGVDAPLPLTDCYVAPCKIACPIGQDAPEYIALTSRKRYRDAVELIYEKNPLPSITGHICAHQCQYNCTRIDYEGAVEIREVKKIALEKGFEEYRAGWRKPYPGRKKKAAIIGAGPAGLSAAFFLAREGFETTVFDEHEDAGGVVTYNIPSFRIPREAIQFDVDFIKEHGVEFVFNYRFDFDTNELKKQGFDYILLAAGADKVRPLGIPGPAEKIMPSHDFIGAFNKDPSSLKLGKHVVVVGAGDTAMDSARTALRVPGVETVTLVYRRSEAQIPSTEEEYDEARAENISFKWLRNPESLSEDGTLRLRVMNLGEADESGRRRPVPSEEFETIPCDTLIPSIGETVDYDEITSHGISAGEKGGFQEDGGLSIGAGVYVIGDVRTGPTTIVNCIAEARTAVDAILEKEGGSRIRNSGENSIGRLPDDLSAVDKRRGTLSPPLESGDRKDGHSFAVREAFRCLECNSVCNKCVDVCPNRANMVIAVPGFNNPGQIVHIDAYCNECGNCSTFCPWNGNPYKEKLTVFSRIEDFEGSSNPGFYLDSKSGELLIRAGSSLLSGTTDDAGAITCDQELPDEYRGIFKALYLKHRYLFGPVEK